MKLHVIHAGYFKLDGGAMFGVVPKSIWNNLNPADENNMCTWAMRCLLIEDKDKLILIDTGIGDKQSEKFFSYYFLHGSYGLLSSLRENGFTPDDITDVFFTHLHFDHCGGAVKRNPEDPEEYELVFGKARYWTNKNHLKWAIKPNPREKASFLKENILPIEEHGKLNLIGSSNPFSQQFDIEYVHGHTESQMLPKIKYKGKTIVFVADLIPSAGHIPLPYVMSYDTRPLLTLKEKESFLEKAARKNYILYFEHDPQIECATVHNTEKGIRIENTFSLSEVL
jgi:glyoxylase-like metal-dependent hydrolase (beta-lactamase superfamily II)